MVVAYTIDGTTLARMRTWAENEVARFGGGGIYGHNEVDTTLRGVMGEWAVRCLYREGGIEARWNASSAEPDISVPRHETIDGVINPNRCEEVKSWANGFSYDNFGNTVRPTHAERYERRGRSRIWFCSCDINTGVVFVHGWATPAEVLAAPIVVTEGRYGAENHHIEVLHRVSEVMPWTNDEDDRMEWW